MLNGVKCNKYRKLERPNISYILDKILVFSIIFDKCGNNNEKVFKEEESIEIIKSFGLINNMNDWYILCQMNIQLFSRKHIVEENITQEFILKNKDEKRSYFITEINQHNLMSKRHEKFSTTLNYIECFFCFSFCGY